MIYKGTDIAFFCMSEANMLFIVICIIYMSIFIHVQKYIYMYFQINIYIHIMQMKYKWKTFLCFRKMGGKIYVLIRLANCLFSSMEKIINKDEVCYPK